MGAFLFGLFKHVIGFTIPVPVAGLVAAYGFYQASAYFDKTAAVKHAVDAAVTELVTGAEKKALQVELEATRKRAEAYAKIAARQIDNAERDRKALEEYRTDAETETSDLKERIDELEKTSGKDSPRLPVDQFDRLHDR